MKKLIFLIFFFFFASHAEAARDFWVSKSGSDSNGCTNSASVLTTTAKITIKEGIKCLTTAGDTLHIGDGTYLENISIDPVSLPTIGNGALYTNPITIKAINRRQVIIDVSSAIFVMGGIDYWIIDGIVFDGSNTTRTSDPHNTYSGTGHIRWTDIESRNNKKNFPNSNPGAGMFVGENSNTEVINCEMHHNGETYTWPIGFDGTQAPYGFYVHGKATIDGCSIHDNGGLGVQFFSSIGTNFDGSIFRNNTVYDNGYNFDQTSSAFSGPSGYSGGTPMQIYNNLFYWTRSSRRDRHTGLAAEHSAVVYNNTVVDYPDGGLGHASTGGFVRNNIVLNNQRLAPIGAGHYPNFDAASATSSNNLCTPSGDSTTCTSIASVAAMNFVSPSTQDYHLLSTSPAINAGITAICSSCGQGGTAISALTNGSFPDAGRYETATVTSAITTDSSNVDAQLQSAYAPFTGISGCTGLTLKVNSVSKSLAGCTLSGNATIRYTCSSPCMVAGDTVQISHLQTSGIADTAGQKLMPWTDFTVTNNLSGGGLFVFASKHFRCRVWNKDLTSNTAQDWYTPEDANCDVQNSNGKIFIINAIDCIGADCSATGFRHRFQVNGGPGWTLVSNSCVTNEFCYDNTQVGGATHGAHITTSLLTDPHSNYVTGGINAQDSSFPIVDLAQNQTTDLGGSFAVKNGLAVGTQICIQPILDNGTVITNDVTGCINVVSPGAQLQ